MVRGIKVGERKSSQGKSGGIWKTRLIPGVRWGRWAMAVVGTLRWWVDRLLAGVAVVGREVGIVAAKMGLSPDE